MPKLTEVLQNTNSRILALENDFDDASGIARITKVYGNAQLSMTVSTRLNTYLCPSSSLYADDDVYNEIYPT